ncbi:50S ribosomal protein L1 [Acinetobacter baumannii]|nr:50S ribosomal protein L1 [Acinetobacter baumannii]TPT93935.1 50S ribosomal protein L1 [Acinetobacter baumannii]
MAKLTKRQKAIAAAVEANKVYTLEEAVQVLNSLPAAKFKESLDISVNLGVDPRKSDQVVRGATTLPAGTGKTVRVAVFAQGAQAEAAKEAGADVVGFDDLAESIQGGNLDFDVVIAAPDAMRVVGKLGTILGPRGLMPNPKVGTVTPDVAGAVKNAKSGQARYRVDKAGIIHAAIGQVGFDAAAIRQNVETLVADLKKLKPATSKGVYIKKITLSSTMGPGLTVDVNNVSNQVKT